MYPVLSVRMQTRLVPQLVMAGQLLHASGGELDELIAQEIQANPALELVHPPGLPYIRTNGVDWLALDERLAAPRPILEVLAEQAAWLVESADLDLALEVIYALDDDGYLRPAAQEELISRLKAPPDRLEQVRRALHELEPPGVAARDLRERLEIQCAALSTSGVACDLPRRILAEAWDDLAAQRWEKIARRLHVSRAAVQAAVEFMAVNLCPHPLGMAVSGGADAPARLAPDLVVRRGEGPGDPCWLEIPAAERLTLRLGSGYAGGGRAWTRDGAQLSPAEAAWIKTQAERARTFMAALEQRWGTLRRLGEFLLAAQADFWEGGPERLKPLTRREVAQALGVHESTISRAVAGKMVQLPDGRLFPLGDLFDPSLPAKTALLRVLNEHGERLNDRQIVDHLEKVGYCLARRTVAKYRQQMRLAPQSIRFYS